MRLACAARHRLLRLLRASGCLCTSRDSSPGSSSTTSPTACIRVPPHVAWLVSLLVVNYFAYAARPGASACRAARHAARRRLLRLHLASGCLGSSSTTSPTTRVRVPRHIAWLVTRLVVDYSASRRLVVDYFAYTVRLVLDLLASWLVVDYSTSRRLVVHFLAYTTRPGSSARHAARRVAHRRLLRLVQARTPRIRVPRHVVRLIIDYFAYTARPGASACRASRHAARHQLLRALRLRLAATLALLQPRRTA
jgi:hypothetical protein